MNDFTLEELETIAFWLDSSIRDWGDPDNLAAIINKIMSLQDNYCEHKNTTQDSVDVDICIDCNEVV
jgi:hypothetical protein